VQALMIETSIFEWKREEEIKLISFSFSSEVIK